MGEVYYRFWMILCFDFIGVAILTNLFFKSSKDIEAAFMFLISPLVSSYYSKDVKKDMWGGIKLLAIILLTVLVVILEVRLM